jgi:acyl-CoA synthetase
MRLYSEERVATFLQEGWWSGATWLDHLAAQVRDFPDRISLVDPANRDAITEGPARRLTWAEVDLEVGQLARALHRAGIRQGDVVGVQLPNIAELAMVYLAVASLGAITSPFPIQYAEHELTQMGTLAGMRGFVTVARAGRARPAQRAAGLVGVIPTLRCVLAWGRDLAAGVVALDDEMTSEAGDAAYRSYVAGLEIHPNDCVTLCWTSGTEGVPKGVPRAPGVDHGERVEEPTATGRLSPSAPSPPRV